MPPAQPLANIQHTLTRAVADRLELRFAMLVGPAAEGRPFRDLDVAVLVERAQAPVSGYLAEARSAGLTLEWSPVFKTPAEIAQGGPLLLDMIETAFCSRPWPTLKPVCYAWGPRHLAGERLLLGSETRLQAGEVFQL